MTDKNDTIPDGANTTDAAGDASAHENNTPAPQVDASTSATASEPAEPSVSEPSKAETKDEIKTEAAPAEPAVKASAEPTAAAASGGLQLSDLPPVSTGTIQVEGGKEHETKSRRAEGVTNIATNVDVPYTPSARHAPDSPTTSLITSLRTQLELVSEQAQQLNTKLVASISRHADLEDQVYGLTHEREQTATHVAELERAKAKWEESMNTGLLVEHAQIRDEMQRLASNLVEEERRRGTAEEERTKVENEVDELSATLFQQANTMVAVERMARAQAEDRLKNSEENLTAAEAAMRDMQAHLQSLPSLQAAAAARAPLPRRFLSSHPPYAEFLLLVQHLRAARPRSIRARDLYPVPSLTNLLHQPFLARCVAEDHDPTLRLDAAADLGWVSRRAVGTAIIAGDLIIEPVGAASLGPGHAINCAMCGRGVFGGGSESTSNASSRFGLKLFSSPSASPAAPASQSVFVFKMANDPQPKSYPLCRNGWCLERLRAACALWHFLRTGLVVPVWNSEDVAHSRQVSGANAPYRSSDSETVVVMSEKDMSAPPSASSEAFSDVTDHSSSATSASASNTAPAQPEPKRKGAWGLGFKLGGGASEKTTTWGGWGSRPTTPKDTPDEEKTEEAAESGDKEKGVVGLEDELNEKEKPPVVDITPAGEEAADLTEKPQTPSQTPSPEDETATNSPTKDAAAEAVADDRASVKSSEGDSFATPNAETRELPILDDAPAADETKEASEDQEPKEEPKEEKDDAVKEEVEAQAETPEAIAEAPEVKVETPEVKVEEPEKNADSPATEESGANGSAAIVAPPKSPSPPVRSAARTPAPPLPPRAAGRPRPSASSAVDSVISPPQTPTAASTDKSGSAEKADESVDESKDAAAEAEKPKAEAEEEATPAESADAPIATEKAVDEPTTPTAASRGVPPPPPPRHPTIAAHSSLPSSPTALLPPPPPRRVVSGATAKDGPAPPSPRLPTEEKTFATGESWEVRTWRQIVKLKEDMWRARVGVVDDE